MRNTPSNIEALQKIRQKLYLAAALALKNNIDLSGELFRIFGSEAPARPTTRQNKTPIKSLSAREQLILDTIPTTGEPITINELLDKLKNKSDTRCSKGTLTICVKILRTLELISYTGSESGKNGYLVKNGIIHD
jgi:hypothetical protein